jgi:hypothetical protein
MHSQKNLSTQKTNFVEVLENGRKCLALVHPCQDSKKRLPEVVVLNSRTTKPKCHTCEGKKCIHINIYIEGANVDVNIED